MLLLFPYSILYFFVFSYLNYLFRLTMLVQAECNEACFNCRGAAEYVPKLGTKLKRKNDNSTFYGEKTWELSTFSGNKAYPHPSQKGRETQSLSGFKGNSFNFFQGLYAHMERSHYSH